REWRIAVALAVSPVVTGSGLAQGSLAEAAERVRQAWLAHNVQAVVGQSASVVLQIPGADPSAPVDRAQAIELLRRHLRAGAERGLRVSAVREVEPGRGYAELDRRYVVARAHAAVAQAQLRVAASRLHLPDGATPSRARCK